MNMKNFLFGLILSITVSCGGKTYFHELKFIDKNNYGQGMSISKIYVYSKDGIAFD